MELHAIITGVYKDTMCEGLKKQFYDDFNNAVSEFVYKAITPSMLPAIKNALKPFLEKYNLKEENLELVWQ